MTLIRNQKGSIKNEKCSFEGTVIENVTSQFSEQQLIKEATHMVDNYSCIILIFTPQTNLAIELGVEPSLHWNYYHQIIYFTWRFLTLLLIYIRYGIIKMQKQSLPDNLLHFLTEKKFYERLVLMER